jgi:hypothetical protein
MYTFEDTEFEWKQNGKGNFVCLRDDSLEATVFTNRIGMWQIVLNGQPFARLVKDEYFRSSEEARTRAEYILKGRASYQTVQMIPRQI